MTNDELDKRVEEVFEPLGMLVHELMISEPNVEQAVSLGALTAALTILNSLRSHEVTIGCELCDIEAGNIQPTETTISQSHDTTSPACIHYKG